MVNFKKKVTILLTLVFLVGFSCPTYGYRSQSSSKNSKRVIRLLKEKLKISDIEIEEARSHGKTAFDLAKTRGMSDEELRQCIVSEATQEIDGMASKGSMPKFLANFIKQRVRIKMRSWNGSLD